MVAVVALVVTVRVVNRYDRRGCNGRRDCCNRCCALLTLHCLRPLLPCRAPSSGPLRHHSQHHYCWQRCHGPLSPSLLHLSSIIGSLPQHKQHHHHDYDYYHYYCDFCHDYDYHDVVTSAATARINCLPTHTPTYTPTYTPSYTTTTTTTITSSSTSSMLPLLTLLLRVDICGQLRYVGDRRQHK